MCPPFSPKKKNEKFLRFKFVKNSFYSEYAWGTVAVGNRHTQCACKPYVRHTPMWQCDVKNILCRTVCTKYDVISLDLDAIPADATEFNRIGCLVRKLLYRGSLARGANEPKFAKGKKRQTRIHSSEMLCLYSQLKINHSAPFDPKEKISFWGVQNEALVFPRFPLSTFGFLTGTLYTDKRYI